MKTMAKLSEIITSWIRKIKNDFLYTPIYSERRVKDKLLKLFKGSMYGLQIIIPLKFGSNQLRSYEIEWVTCLFAQLFPRISPFSKVFSYTEYCTSTQK